MATPSCAAASATPKLDVKSIAATLIDFLTTHAAARSA
jgi:hypothetical protein